MTKKLGLLLTLSMAIMMNNTVLAAEADMGMKELAIAEAQPQKRFLSFDEVKDLCETMSGELKQKEWKALVAVTRGGLVPTALFSQHLPNRLILNICLQSYSTDHKRKEIQMLHDPKLPNEGEGYLIIDEISDSGNTFRYLRNIYPKATYVALYAKPEGKDVADYVGEHAPQDQWIVFPWEVD